jgi:outer membrane immunogenic protein
MMAELASRLLFALSLVSMAGAAYAQSDTPWNGGYLGLNLGEASTDACNSWSAGGTDFDIRNCPGSTFVGGVQIGDNFQYKRLVWGLEADLDIWRGGNRSETVKYAGGAALPPGTYSASGRLTSDKFAIIAPRIGYAGTQWMPYVTAGFITPLGSHNTTLNYLPAGAAGPTGSFSGGKNYASGGWVAGGGAEWGLNGPWSIKAEFLHVSLGNGSNSTAEFSGTTLNSNHTSFSANMFRIGINYWFSYWGL